jgi:CRISPR/Cas system CSM-associated protein Csm5 (group 7 of RAMP superfamily)
MRLIRLGFLDKLKKSQNAFDENWIMDHKEHWKKKFQNLSKNEMEDKLKEIESHPQFDSSKSAKRIFWGGGIGSAMHISDREREAQRRAIRELLGLKW